MSYPVNSLLINMGFTIFTSSFLGYKLAESYDISRDIVKLEKLITNKFTSTDCKIDRVLEYTKKTK